MGRRRSDDPRIAGFLTVDKPAGVTSHDVVARVRRALGLRRVGHSGTLDPMATGLLLVGVGWVTRVLRYSGDFTKTYEGEITFGTATDTLDAEGEVVRRVEMHVVRDALEDALASFVGDIEQTPPMVSAVQVGGERLHEKARRGESVEREPRRVTVHELSLVSLDGVRARIQTRVSSGTYVRVLADDVGRVLGGAAHLSGLRRTRIGPYRVEDAVSLPRLDAEGRGLLRPAADATFGLERVEVASVDVDAVLAGRVLPGLTIAGPTALLHAGALLAVHEPAQTGVRIGCVAPREAV
ncbi:MAG: tRNA pseudouridine(55) synthase TruB [Acidimicrobiia bacterium]|nr:tRNA pseudouridine(55) synthase TruB [Acidimicrobiia bacterium]